MENNNIRRMEYAGVDDWDKRVYKCVETGTLYKDISDFKWLDPELCTCGNDFYGEPGFPIDTSNLEIHFIGTPDQETEEQKFNYQMIDRLKQDCDYYLKYGNHNKKHLWAGDEQEQINEMKKLYNGFPNDKKPEWLTYHQILEYEKLMI